MEKTDNSYSNRMILLLIAGIPVTVILSATWLWYFVVRGDLDLVNVLGTANRGALVQPPRQIDEANLHEQNGMVFRNANLEPRWTFIVPGAGGRCDAFCEKSLYLTRQIHVALGKEFNRVRRLYVADTATAETQLAVQELSDARPAPADFSTYLAGEHRGLVALAIQSAEMDLLFAEYRADPSTWYLMDPAGWIMMSYNSDISYKDVIADLKFLLKNSPE